MPPTIQTSLPELVQRARTLVTPGERRVLGLTGAPGAGKSTLAAGLVEALGNQAALVPMDGFHLANAELLRLGRHDRKGAPDTFDAGGYADLLARLNNPQGRTIYAPLFDRAFEESIGSALAVPPEASLIVTEGNYLLLESGDWSPVRAAIHQVWYVELDERVRLERLTRRHIEFGKSPDAAAAWVERVDGHNAGTIRATRERADLIVQLSEA